MGGRAYSVQRRDEIREKQAKSGNTSYYALKNTIWEQNWWGEDASRSRVGKRRLILHSQAGKLFPFPGFSPSFTAGALSIPEKHLFWHRQRTGLDHLLNVQFPPNQGNERRNPAFSQPRMNRKMDWQNICLEGLNKTHFENDAYVHD